MNRSTLTICENMAVESGISKRAIAVTVVGNTSAIRTGRKRARAEGKRLAAKSE